MEIKNTIKELEVHAKAMQAELDVAEAELKEYANKAKSIQDDVMSKEEKLLKIKTAISNLEAYLFYIEEEASGHTKADPWGDVAG